MPKKKTGARKKAEKQKEVLRVIRTGGVRELGKWPCNALMECDQCKRCCLNRHMTCDVKRLNIAEYAPMLAYDFTV